MRFFTRSWHSGDLPDAEADAVGEAYELHLAQILPRLPLAARVLAQSISIHDARVRRVVLDAEKRELLLALRCGDQQAGYYDFDLRFLGVSVAASDADQLSEAAEDPQTEVLYAELDIEEEDPVYRILFWPYRECSVRFQDAEIRLSPQPGREIPAAERRFLQAGSPAA